MNNPYNPKIHHRRSIRLRGYDYSQAGCYFITMCTQNRLHLFGEIVGADSISALVDSGSALVDSGSALVDSGSAPVDSESGPMDSVAGDRDVSENGGVSESGADMESAPTGGTDFVPGDGGTEFVSCDRAMDSVGPEMILNVAGKMVSRIWHEISVDFHNVRLHEFVIMPNHIHGIIEIIPMGADCGSGPLDSGSGDGNVSGDGADMESAPTGNPSLSVMIQSFKRHTTIEYIKMVKQNILPPFTKRIWQRNYWEHIIRNENEYLKIARYVLDNPATWELDTLHGGIGNQVMESQAPYNDEVWMV